MEGKSAQSPVKIFIVAILILIPLIGLNLYNILSDKLDAEARVYQRMLEVSRLVASTQERYIESTRQLLIALASIPQVQAVSSDQCSAYLAKILKEYPFYTNFGVIELDGNLICSAVTPQEKINLSDEFFFIDALKSKDFAIGGYRVAKVTGKEVISIGYPIKDPSDKVVAIVYTSIGLDWLNELVSQQRFDEESIILLLDKKGQILARNPDPEKWVGKSIPDKALMKTILTSIEGVVEDEAGDGKRYLFAFTPLIGSDNSVFLVGGILKEPLYRELNNTFMTRIIFLIAAIFITLLLILGFIRMGKSKNPKAEEDKDLGEVAEALEDAAQSIQKHLKP